MEVKLSLNNTVMAFLSFASSSPVDMNFGKCDGYV